MRSHPHTNAQTVQLADFFQADTLIGNVQPLPQATLKKYLLYAKAKIRPELSQVDVDNSLK